MKVTRPLGAEITLDYHRTGNTYELPSSRWVLSRVSVFDGLAGDTPGDTLEERNLGADFQVTEYTYEGGLQDRHERDFLGFARVSELWLDTRGKHTLARAQAADPYTRRVMEYDVRNVYT